MLNRRILRIKAFKVVYEGAVKGGMSLKDAKKELDSSCEAVRDLYLYMLAIISPLTSEAARRIEAAKSKFNPTEEDLHPNEKFAKNALAKYFDEDPDFQKIIEKKKLSWEPYDIFIRSVYDSISSKEYFAKYMASEGTSLKEDCKLFTKIFEEEFVDNEKLEAILEDISIYWVDDLAYALTWCCNSLSDIAGGKQWHLPELYLSDETKRAKPDANLESDSDFVHKLTNAALSGYENYLAQISDKVTSREKDRLYATDTAIIALALAEADIFPDTPIKVILNEYIEISKYYSMPVSSKFVNGVLNELLVNKNNQ